VRSYPIFLVGLERRRSVVVGGDREALRKIEGLLECDAAVEVIAAEPIEEIRRLAGAGRVRWIAREFRRGDLAGAFLVIATVREPALRATVFEEAESAGALANVVDDTAHCSFVAGSVVRRGPLRVAIGTGGAAPALAVRLRERLERELGPEYDRFLRWMDALRAPVARRWPDFDERRRRWYAVVDSDALGLLRAGHEELARRRIEGLLDVPIPESESAA
jgi:siroheme synthase-like protein